MKQKRAPESVDFFRYDKGFSPIFITAALSLLALLGAAGWEMSRISVAHNAPAPSVNLSGGSITASPAFENVAPAEATNTDPLSTLGDSVVAQLQNAYVQMRQAGVYSSSTALAAGESLAPYISANVQYPAMTAADVATDADTSYDRMMRYRADLRVSLAPLVQNTQPEFEIFGYYVQTHDSSYLTKLRAVAQDYLEAASSTAHVVAPRDAALAHAGIVNAMQQFGATLNAMAQHADDPFAAAALLQNYQHAEADMASAFNTLISYEKSKLP